jgi:predicted permease
MAESIVVVAVGAILGSALAVAATRVLAHWARIDSGLDPDRHVLLFTLIIASLVAIAFSLTPFSRAMRISVDQSLRSITQIGSQSRGRTRIGNCVVALQIAMCFTLLVAAGLTVRTLLNYEHLDLGMRAQDLLVFDVTPQGLERGVQSWSYYNRIIDRIRAIPGVESVSVAQWRPGSGWLRSSGVRLDGTVLLSNSGKRANIPSNAVGSDFFHTLGIPVLQGRDFSSADTPSSKPVAIVNQAFAERYLKDGALGHTVDDAEIIGVVRNSKYKAAAEVEGPTIYQSLPQMGMAGQITFEVRTTLEPLSLLPEVRRAVNHTDPNLALQKPMTQAAQFEQTYTTPMLFARLATGFGVLAIVLVATGLYGTLTYRLQRRRSEIGIRMAVGAQRSDVLQMIFRESFRIAVIGFAVGLPLSIAIADLLRSQLYQLSSFDMPSFTAALGITLLASLASAFVPAHTAAQIDPMEAIRGE